MVVTYATSSAQTAFIPGQASSQPRSAGRVRGLWADPPVSNDPGHATTRRTRLGPGLVAAEPVGSGSAGTASRLDHWLSLIVSADFHAASSTLVSGELVACLLYTSDADDDLTRVDLGGRRIIKKKKKKKK